MAKPKLYSMVCWFFVAAFAVTMLLILFLPEGLGELLTWAGDLVGLSGTIELAPTSLDHVLALSLMATIVFLGQASARDPYDDNLYYAIQTAKFVSTAGFALLAVTEATVWVLPALTDGTVIVGLAWAHRGLGSSGATAAR